MQFTDTLRQDWKSVEQSLDANGNALLPGLLTVGQCRELAALYPQDDVYRSRIVMARHGFGRGDYNCLHQDLYGDHVFPLQVAVLLSRPDLFPEIKAAHWHRLAPTDTPSSARQWQR